MTKPPKKPKPEEIETDPGAQERFEHAVDAAIKSGPKHRVSPKPRKTTQTKAVGVSVSSNGERGKTTKKRGRR